MRPAIEHSLAWPNVCGIGHTMYRCTYAVCMCIHRRLYMTSNRLARTRQAAVQRKCVISVERVLKTAGSWQILSRWRDGSALAAYDNLCISALCVPCRASGACHVELLSVMSGMLSSMSLDVYLDFSRCWAWMGVSRIVWWLG